MKKILRCVDNFHLTIYNFYMKIYLFKFRNHDLPGCQVNLDINTNVIFEWVLHCKVRRLLYLNQFLKSIVISRKCEKVWPLTIRRYTAISAHYNAFVLNWFPVPGRFSFPGPLLINVADRLTSFRAITTRVTGPGTFFLITPYNFSELLLLPILLPKWGCAPTLYAWPRDFPMLWAASRKLVFFACFFEVFVKRTVCLRKKFTYIKPSHVPWADRSFFPQRERFIPPSVHGGLLLFRLNRFYQYIAAAAEPIEGNEFFYLSFLGASAHGRRFFIRNLSESYTSQYVPLKTGITDRSSLAGEGNMGNRRFL